MPLLEAREESYVSHLGDKRVLNDPLSPSPDESFPHEQTLFEVSFRKGKQSKGGGGGKPPELPLTLFPLSIADPKPLTLKTLRKHEELQKQERRQKRQEREQAWEDFWASFSTPMDNTTKEGN